MAPEREMHTPIVEESQGIMPEAPLSFRQAEEENVISGHPIAAETTSTPGNADERSV